MIRPMSKSSSSPLYLEFFLIISRVDAAGAALSGAAQHEPAGLRERVREAASGKDRRFCEIIIYKNNELWISRGPPRLAGPEGAERRSGPRECGKDSCSAMGMGWIHLFLASTGRPAGHRAKEKAGMARPCGRDRGVRPGPPGFNPRAAPRPRRSSGVVPPRCAGPGGAPCPPWSWAGSRGTPPGAEPCSWPACRGRRR